MTIGSLFSGIGGLELGAEAAELGPVIWQVEQDAFCRGILARHWPNADRSVCDVREAGASNLAHVDAIVGGFPCQDVSAAGKGAGLSGSRSGLWYEFRRIVGELEPPIVVVENVASGARRWVEPVRASLREAGYSTCAVGISALDVGAPHVRERVFIVSAHSERFKLWLERRGRERADRKSSPLSPNFGEKGDTPRIHWEWSERRGRTFAKSPVPLLANGVPDRVAIERAIGNSVVPQCAQAAISFGLDTLSRGSG